MPLSSEARISNPIASVFDVFCVERIELWIQFDGLKFMGYVIL